MEYEEKLVHNVLMATQNAIVSVAKMVEDNVLHVITTQVIVSWFATPQNPAANLLHDLLMMPNALVIK